MMTQSKAIAFGYLMKVSAGNVNASHTEGNIMVAKKVTLPDGSTRPYISGQALRRMLRDRLEDLGFSLSEAAAIVSGQEVAPPVEPWHYIDEDLFGYLDPRGGRRRTSPVRVSTAIGAYPFTGDRDLGTRSFERFGKSVDAGGNMFETELYHNIFLGNILIELDRVGVYTDLEIGTKTKAPDTLSKIENKKRVEYVLPKDHRIERLVSLVEAFNLLWGGGRTARMLNDLSPRFVAYARMKVKHPVFIESLKIKFTPAGHELVLDPLVGALEKFAYYRDQYFFGLEKGFLANEDEVKTVLQAYGNVMPLHEAIQAVRDDIPQAVQS